jgi:hypothetical protein
MESASPAATDDRDGEGQEADPGRRGPHGDHSSNRQGARRAERGRRARPHACRPSDTANAGLDNMTLERERG